MLCLFLLAISRKLLCQEKCPGSSVSTSIESPGEIYIPVGSTKHFRCVSLDSMATVVWNVILRGDSEIRLGTENDIRLNENGVSIEPYIPSNVSVLTLDTTAGENVTTLACRVSYRAGGVCFITSGVTMFSKDNH